MDDNLPILVIMQKKEDTVPNERGGNLKFFEDYTKSLEEKFVSQLHRLNKEVVKDFDNGEKISVAKVKMKTEAIAKSYKPGDFCKEFSIIGGDDLDEILVGVNPESINKTIENIQYNPPQTLKANLTAMRSIEKYSADEKLTEMLKLKIENDFENIKSRIKIELFDFDDEYLDVNNYIFIKDILLKKNLCSKIEEIKFDNKLQYIKAQINNKDDIYKIADLCGVRTVDAFDDLSLSYDEYDDLEESDIDTTNMIKSDVIIGIIDGGIADIDLLKDYIYAREVYVPEEYQNRDHGTFIASTIQYGDILNQRENMSNKLFQFLDVIAIPNGNPRKGLVDTLSEEDLMSLIEEVMDKYADKVKIWNLSLGFKNQICDKKMSSIGKFLDRVQDKYKVQFFISSGNLNPGVVRKWPVEASFTINDKIIAPADSIRAITVGSIASRENENSIVKINEPSPFGRIGPGPNYTVKPDIVDYGGNVDRFLSIKNLGIKGLNANGKIVENVGTSFSCPGALKKYACIIDEMVKKDILLAKALLIHSARLNSKDLISDESNAINYYGFGVPKNSYSNILSCKKNEVTMIFKQKLTKGTHLEMKDFPYPKSLLRNNRWYGEVCMTLVYMPSLDGRYGKEYCRSNVDVSFGTYRYIDGKEDYKGKIPLEKSWDEKYEKERIKNGFKWSPIKSYYKKFVRGVQKGEGWKIRVDLLGRYNTNIVEQEFVLIVTIKDDKGNDIYTELVNELRARGYAMNNLETRLQSRIKE